MNPRPIVILLATVALLAACGAEPSRPAAPAEAPKSSAGDEGTVYGKPLESVATVALADLVAHAADYEGKEVRVEGTVTDVCSKRGCWIKLGDDKTRETVTFKVVDGVMVFPMSARGKHAVADGKVQRMKLTLEQTRQVMEEEARESGKSFDPASVTEPMTTVRLAGIGARIRDSR